MDKRNPTYHLEDIQLAFQSVDSLRMTRTAKRCIVELDLEDDVVFIIQSLKRQHFYKSMTTYANHKVWQDVYHYNYNGLMLYIKFMMDDEGHIIVSFKEK